MYRKCAGCRQWRNCSTPVGVKGWACDDCSVAFNIFGTNARLKNVAEQQSKEWRAGPCPHQHYDTSRVRDKATGKMVQISTCRNPKCGAEIYRVLI